MFETPEQGSLLTPSAEKVTQNTICIIVRKGRFGTKKKASTATVKVESDKALLALSKTILSSPELKKVQQLDSEMTTVLKSLCLKSMFRGGVYLIGLGLVEEANSRLEDFAARRAILVDAAVATYDECVEQTGKRLDELHDPADYPSKERFKQRFYLEWQFVTWDTPTRLKSIKPALFEMERQKAAAKLSAVADDCRAAMRSQLKDLVSHVVDRLTPTADGKKKRLSKSTVKNFNEFFRTFQMKNVTDDVELATVVAQARAAMAGSDIDDLRKDDAVRAAFQQQFEQLKADLAPMVADRGDREIELDDEEEDESE